MRTSWKVLGWPPGQDRHTVSHPLRGKSSHVSPPRPTPSFPPCPAVPQQAYTPCSCPVSRPKKAPRVSNTDVAGLMDGGLTHWEQGLGDTHTHCAAKAAGPGGRFCSREQGLVISYRGHWTRWAHRLPGKPAEGQAPHCPFNKNYHEVGLGQESSEGRSGEWMDGRQALVEPRRDREQEDHHLQWSEPLD